MKAMILAAGLGTRLRPWTLEHPKALVPVAGIPMLERVILKLRSNGFEEIVINVHHFADQIKSFLCKNDFGVKVTISDESDALLDTGGGIVNALPCLGGGPVLVHNVDILSNADLAGLMLEHMTAGNDVTLLTSGRDSSRRLLFDEQGCLRGWHNLTTGEYRPEGGGHYDFCVQEAFSGIYVLSQSALNAMGAYAKEKNLNSFPIMDFFLTLPKDLKIRRVLVPALRLIDIGKPETLACALETLKIME